MRNYMTYMTKKIYFGQQIVLIYFFPGTMGRILLALYSIFGCLTAGDVTLPYTSFMEILVY